MLVHHCPHLCGLSQGKGDPSLKSVMAACLPNSRVFQLGSQPNSGVPRNSGVNSVACPPGFATSPAPELASFSGWPSVLGLGSRESGVVQPMFMVHRVMIRMGLKGLSTQDERHEQKRARTSDISDVSKTSNSRYISDISKKF